MADKPRDGSHGGSRLPPPAFPPGSGGRRDGNSKRASQQDVERAFISPEDPMPERARPSRPKPARSTARAEVRGAFAAAGQPPEEVTAMADEDAFISPDEPIPHRDPVKSGERFGLGDVDPGEVLVTGMGSDAHMDPGELAFGSDPHLTELVSKVSKLAEALRQRGEAGLRTGAGMDRFETTLRAYCVGYLAGRRAEDDPPSEF